MNWLAQYQFLAFVALTTAVGIFFAWALWNMRKKIRLILGGPQTDEEGLRRDLMRRIARAEAQLEELAPRLNILEGIAAMSVQKVGFLRFNPFSDTGGNNSFVLVLLDRDNNGVIISSLYLRESARLYAKEIKKGNARSPLSAEEKQVLEIAVRKG